MWDLMWKGKRDRLEAISTSRKAAEGVVVHRAAEFQEAAERVTHGTDELKETEGCPDIHAGGRNTGMKRKLKKIWNE